MTEGRCDFCGSSMNAVGGLFSAPRASICIGCAQSAVDALSNRSEVALTGVTSLQLPPGSVITTPLAQPVTVAPTVVTAPAARRAGITIPLDSRTVAKVVVIVLAALVLSRRRR